MASVTHYVCQRYEWKQRGQNERELEKSEGTECSSGPAAIELAEKIFDGGVFAGVDAYKVVVDADAGDYGCPEFLARLGDVPKVDEECF